MVELLHEEEEGENGDCVGYSVCCCFSYLTLNRKREKMGEGFGL